jgi:hypothetical protein
LKSTIGTPFVEAALRSASAVCRQSVGSWPQSTAMTSGRSFWARSVAAGVRGSAEETEKPDSSNCR